MTYQEIIQAIESLPRHERDRLIESIGQQQVSPIASHSNESHKTNAINRTTSIDKTPEERAECLRKFRKFIQLQQNRWENMAPEEREANDLQFQILDETLRESRGLGDRWE
jgi:hypothetical protein